MPLSFRFYDPIQLVIHEKLSLDRREYYQVKKQLALIFDEKSVLIRDDKEQQEKLVYRENDVKEIGHHGNPEENNNNNLIKQ